MGGPQAPPSNAAVARGRRVPRRRGAHHSAASGGGHAYLCYFSSGRCGRNGARARWRRSGEQRHSRGGDGVKQNRPRSEIAACPPRGARCGSARGQAGVGVCGGAAVDWRGARGGAAGSDGAGGGGAAERGCGAAGPGLGHPGTGESGDGAARPGPAVIQPGHCRGVAVRGATRPRAGCECGGSGCAGGPPGTGRVAEPRGPGAVWAGRDPGQGHREPSALRAPAESGAGARVPVHAHIPSSGVP
uniref:myosin heavy chain IB-like n=1 Tax=Agelaius phoeniceus TaxID=39638 RepID=UPI0023EC3083|nr:myosin heavy chain IB-like [Agelaius phoeniceus]